MKTNKVPWQLYEWYKGCPIEFREGLQRRGWVTTYHNWYNDDGKIGDFIHHSLENARKHIDKLHKDLGDRIALTEEEWKDFISK